MTTQRRRLSRSEDRVERIAVAIVSFVVALLWACAVGMFLALLTAITGGDPWHPSLQYVIAALLGPMYVYLRDYLRDRA